MTRAQGLDVRQLAVRYRAEDPPVINALDLKVAPGSFTVVFGPSGCGKSTLLNCVAGFVSPCGGSVQLDGAVIEGPGRDRGVVFQHDVLYPWMTAGANIAFGMQAVGAAKGDRHRRIGELLAAVGLDADVRSKLPHELSGGMRQRVGIARMLAISPRIMLMDEPFGALDAMTRLSMQDTVIDLWEARGATVLFITHDVDEALRLSTDVLVLGAGGRLLDQFVNPLPRPRPAAGLADFDEYPGLRRHLHGLLGLGRAATRATAP